VIAAPPPPPARVQVVVREFGFALSRESIRAGLAVIELRNAGQDAHDLLIRRAGATRVLVRWPVTQPGGVVDRQMRLRPGTYRLTCGVANHRALGMQATLVVRK
jgi:hypothetical protein